MSEIFGPRSLSLLLGSALFLSHVQATQAEPPSNSSRIGSVQRGSIELESENKKTESYSDIRTNASQFLKDLKSRIEALSRGETTTSQVAPAESTIKFLTAVYLSCSINAGTCPSVLQAVLEYDVINSRMQQKADCPVMLKFWKHWVDGDMEKRHQFKVRTVYINATSEFKSKVRPRYVRCGSTVTEEIKGDLPDSQYFKERYKSGSEIVAAVTRASSIVDEIKTREEEDEKKPERSPNLYQTLGIQQ